jgi:hypothetical protein
MPRKSRIDAPGALRHIIARGVERCKMFRDNADGNNFLDRLGSIVKTIKPVLVRGKSVRKEGRNNSRERLQACRALSEKLEN